MKKIMFVSCALPVLFFTSFKHVYANEDLGIKEFSNLDIEELQGIPWANKDNLIDSSNNEYLDIDAFSARNINPQNRSFKTGVYGSVPWLYNSSTGELTFESGEFPSTNVHANVKLDIERITGPILKITFSKPVKLSPFSHSMFGDLIWLQEVNGGNLLDTSNAYNMCSFFKDTRNLKTVDVSNWDVSNVTDMRRMFSGASSLETVDVSSWDVSKVGDASSMFEEATSLNQLDVSNWKTSSFFKVDKMFQNTRNLTKLDTSNWSIAATQAQHMFDGARSLTSLDLNGFDLNLVVYIRSMLANTDSLETLILGRYGVLSKPTSAISGDVGLPEIENDTYTGAWVSEDKSKIFPNSHDFMYDNYYGYHEGKYIRERRPTKVTGIEIPKKKYEISIGEAFNLEAIVKPTDATNKKVLYSSSNPKVATVDTEGRVVGLNSGTATITAITDDGGFKGETTVSVLSSEYTIEYVANGTNVTGSMEKQSVEIDQEFTISDSRFIKTGYICDYWTKDPEGNGTKYQPNDRVKNLGEAGSIVKLYAQWTPIKYEIVYADPSSFSTNSFAQSLIEKTKMEPYTQPMEYDKEEELLDNRFSKVGYIHVGWRGESSIEYQSKQRVRNLTSNEGEQVSLLTKWKSITYNVKFDRNTGKGNMVDEVYSYDVSAKLPKNQFTKSKYQFLGWSTDKNAKIPEYEDEGEISNLSNKQDDTVTLYAIWDEDRFLD